jgi:hypothetical protein
MVFLQFLPALFDTPLIKHKWIIDVVVHLLALFLHVAMHIREGQHSDFRSQARQEP